jgi:alpha-tubulin suppressor-like RCC1 family protein
MSVRRICFAIALMIGLTMTVSQAADASSEATYHWGSYQEVGKNLDVPNAVGNLTDVTAIAAGNISGMALAGGNVYTFGSGFGGEFGDGSTDGFRKSARVVPGLPDIVAIGESMDTDVAVSDDGNVYGWGRNRGGQLCTGNTTEYNTPVELTSLSNVASAAGGALHMIYLTDSGAVESCGSNGSGQLGGGKVGSDLGPISVQLPDTAVAITSGSDTSAALLDDGQVWDWGSNTWGQLGDGSTRTKSSVPVQVPLPSAAIEVSSGGSSGLNGQTLALLANGQVWGWGCDTDGQLGNGSEQNTNSLPIPSTALPSDVTFTDVESGGAFGLALDSSGNVWAWGDNDNGQVGSGNYNDAVLDPVEVLSEANLISATASDALAHVS